MHWALKHSGKYQIENESSIFRCSGSIFGQPIIIKDLQPEELSKSGSRSSRFMNGSTDASSVCDVIHYVYHTRKKKKRRYILNIGLPEGRMGGGRERLAVWD